MSALKLSTKKKYQISKYMIKMNTRNVCELRNIPKEQDLCHYLKFRKAESAPKKANTTAKN